MWRLLSGIKVFGIQDGYCVVFLGLNKRLFISIRQKQQRKKLTKNIDNESAKNPQKLQKMMNHLARQKFGNPPSSQENENEDSRHFGAEKSIKSSKISDKSSKVSKLSSKIKTPRQTKLTLSRAQYSKSKLVGTTPTENDLKSESCFNDDTISQQSFRTQTSKIYFENFLYKTTQTSEIYQSTSKDDKFEPNLTHSESSSESKILLEISDIELDCIVSNKRQFLNEKKDSELMSTFYSSIDSDVIIANVSNLIVNELVENVCKEVFDAKLISTLIQLEMKD